MDFLVPPETYYDSLIARLKDSKVQIKEDMDLVRARLVLYGTALGKTGGGARRSLNPTGPSVSTRRFVRTRSLSTLTTTATCCRFSPR